MEITPPCLTAAGRTKLHDGYLRLSLTYYSYTLSELLPSRVQFFIPDGSLESPSRVHSSCIFCFGFSSRRFVSNSQGPRRSWRGYCSGQWALDGGHWHWELGTQLHRPVSSLNLFCLSFLGLFGVCLGEEEESVHILYPLYLLLIYVVTSPVSFSSLRNSQPYP